MISFAIVRLPHHKLYIQFRDPNRTLVTKIYSILSILYSSIYPSNYPAYRRQISKLFQWLLPEQFSPFRSSNFRSLILRRYHSQTVIWILLNEHHIPGLYLDWCNIKWTGNLLELNVACQWLHIALFCWSCPRPFFRNLDVFLFSSVLFSKADKPLLEDGIV